MATSRVSRIRRNHHVEIKLKDGFAPKSGGYAQKSTIIEPK